MILHDDHIHLRPHTHPPQPHDLKSVLDAARARGVIPGIREHPPLPRRFQLGPNRDFDYAMHPNEVNAFLQQFADCNCPLGLEVDFLPGEEDETADIINSMIAHAASLGAPVSGIHGSMHLLPGTIDDGLGPKGDVQFVIWDLDAKIFETHLKDRGPKRILHDYFGALCELIDTGLYDALSHIELIRKFDQRNQAGHSVYFHDVEDLYDRLARDAIEKAAAANLAIEINVSGMARPIGRPFISQSLLNHAVACGAPICVGSDAHLPEHVGAYFDEAERMLESAGCDTLVTFNNRKQIPYKLT
jgi:histidinol-phosphatase (PHP family)